MLIQVALLVMKPQCFHKEEEYREQKRKKNGSASLILSHSFLTVQYQLTVFWECNVRLFEDIK